MSPVSEKVHQKLSVGGTHNTVAALLWTNHALIMAEGSVPWQTFSRILLLTLSSTFILGKVEAQCFSNLHLGTKPSRNLEYRTDILSLKESLISVLDFTSLIKQELPQESNNISVTYPGDSLCAMVGLGHGLDYLTTDGLALVNEVPLLTNIIQISGDRFVVPNQNVPAHLNVSQLQTLLLHLNIDLRLSEGSAPQMFIRKDNSGQLHLENFNIQEPNRCQVGPVMNNVFHGLMNTLQILQKTYEDVENIIRFFGSEHLYTNLQNCLQTPNATLSVLMKVDPDNLDYCVAKLANATVPRLVKRSTMLDWMFGSGQQLDQIEHSLMDAIGHFNRNFKKVSAFDEEVMESFDRLEKDISSLVEIEARLQDRMGDLQVHTKLMEVQNKYIINRIQHEAALSRLLKESKMMENIKLLSRSLFGQNECHLGLCESSISPEILPNDVVKIHREVISLLPTTMAMISCMATKTTAIPVLHHQLAEITTQSKVLINNQLFSSSDLLNTSVVNQRLRPLTDKDIALELFHHFANNSQLFLQCVFDGDYRVDGEPAQCSVGKFFKLKEDQVVEANGQVLRSHMLIQRTHHVRTAWLSSFTFSNVDKLSIPPPEQFTVLHPSIESIFFTEAGQVHIAHTSYFFTIIFFLTLLGIGLCCCKFPACRNGFISRIINLKEKAYIAFTSKEFRDQKELEDLNIKVNTNFRQIEDMEQLIAKKTALLAAKENASLALSSSNSPPAPSDAEVSAQAVQADIHITPSKSGSITQLKQLGVKKK